MDNNLNEPFFSANFGKDIAKSLLISAATTAGMFAGIAAITYVANSTDKLRNKLKAKKETPVV